MAGAVRAEDEVFELLEGELRGARRGPLLLGQRVAVPDVEAGAQAAAAQGLEEGALVDQARAADVDEHGALGEQRELAGAEEAFALGRERQGQDDGRGARQEFVQLFDAVHAVARAAGD